MSRPSSRIPSVEEGVAMVEADYRAHNFISKLPKQVAVITSVKVADALAELWKIEAEAMILRGDQRYVYKSTSRERCWLASAVAACSQNPLWSSCSVEQVQKLLANLPPDAAALVAYDVARSICHGEKFK